MLTNASQLICFCVQRLQADDLCCHTHVLDIDCIPRIFAMKIKDKSVYAYYIVLLYKLCL